ncbi:MAG: hypothetical protein WDW38_006220 [Sanguina aurantia]
MLCKQTPTLGCSSKSCNQRFVIRCSSIRPARKCCSVSQQQRHQQVSRDTRAAFFKFGKNGFGAEAAGIVGSQGRDEYILDDLEQYFNYMGFLAEEGNYDRMNSLTEKGLHPIDAILLLAARENDLPKIQEILIAGADITATDATGKTALQLATKADLLELLQQAAAKVVKA